jgi:hypothetical protein
VVLKDSLCLVSHLTVVPQSFGLITALRVLEQVPCMLVGSYLDPIIFALVREQETAAWRVARHNAA